MSLVRYCQILVFSIMIIMRAFKCTNTSNDNLTTRHIPSDIWKHCIYPFIPRDVVYISVRGVNKQAKKCYDKRHGLNHWIALRNIISDRYNYSDLDHIHEHAVHVSLYSTHTRLQMTQKLLLLLRQSPFITATDRYVLARSLIDDIFHSGSPRLLFAPLLRMLDMLYYESLWRRPWHEQPVSAKQAECTVLSLIHIFRSALSAFRRTGIRENRYLRFALLHLEWLAHYESVRDLLWLNVDDVELIADYLQIDALANHTLSPRALERVSRLIIEDVFRHPTRTELNKKRLELFLARDRLLFGHDMTFWPKLLGHYPCRDDQSATSTAMLQFTQFMLDHGLVSFVGIVEMTSLAAHSRLFRALNGTLNSTHKAHNPLVARLLLRETNTLNPAARSVNHQCKCCEIM